MGLSVHIVLLKVILLRNLTPIISPFKMVVNIFLFIVGKRRVNFPLQPFIVSHFYEFLFNFMQYLSVKDSKYLDVPFCEVIVDIEWATVVVNVRSFDLHSSKFIIGASIILMAPTVPFFVPLEQLDCKFRHQNPIFRAILFNETNLFLICSTNHYTAKCYTKQNQ